MFYEIAIFSLSNNYVYRHNAATPGHTCQSLHSFFPVVGAVIEDSEDAVIHVRVYISPSCTYQAIMTDMPKISTGHFLLPILSL